MATSDTFIVDKKILLVSYQLPEVPPGWNAEIQSQIYLLTPKLEKMTNSIADEADVHKEIEYELLDIFMANEDKKSAQEQFRTVKILVWNLFKGLSIVDQYRTTMKINGKIFRTAIEENSPVVSVGSSGKCSYQTGYLYDIVSLAAEFLHFRMKPVCTPAIIGEVLPNGKVTGIFKSAMNKEMDFAIYTVVLTPTTAKVLQPHFYYLINHLGIWFKNEGTMKIPNHFSAFSIALWFIFINSIVLTAIILSVALTQSPLSKTNQHLQPHSEWARRSKSTIPTIRKLFSTMRWFISGEFLEQALKNAPGISVKILMCTLSVTCTLVFLHYLSLFSSVLTSHQKEMPFTTLEGLVQNLDYRIGLLTFTGIANKIKNSKDEVFRSVWTRFSLRMDNGAISTTDGIMKVCNEDKYALVFDVESTSYEVEKMRITNCSLKVISTNDLKNQLLIGMPYDFPYAKTFSNVILRLTETGIMDRVKQKYFKNSKLIRTPNNIKYSKRLFSFGFNHIIIPLSILGIGIVVSLLVLLLELVINSCS